MLTKNPPDSAIPPEHKPDTVQSGWLALVMRQIIRPAGALITMAWPLLIWLAIHYHVLNWLLPVMALLLATKLLLAGKNRSPLRGAAYMVALVALTLCLASAVLRQYQLLLYYPVVVNLVLLVLFASSLCANSSLIERLACWRDPSLVHNRAYPAMRRYTRRVTWLWSGFFILNGAIALATCLHGNMALWALWNGLLSYLAIGLLMGGEWLLRQRIIKRMTL